MKSVILDGLPLFPSKVVCIGRNYVEHIQELDNEQPDEPVIFIKPNTAVSNQISLHQTDEIHYEGEICFLICSGKIVAVGFGLDLTKRELQSKLKAKGLPWERAKAFDGAAVLGDFVTFKGNIEDLQMELSINEQLVQSGSYHQMIFKPADVIEDVQVFLTLEDGDIIMSGTPKGVGVINEGDKFVGKIFYGSKLLVESTWIA